MAEDWIERRQRVLRCKAHGLHYDPKLASGCTLCLKDKAGAPPQRAPHFTTILLCVLGMSIVLFQIFGPQQSAEGGVGTVPQEVAVEVTRWAPDPYRPWIRALETDLFRRVGDDDTLAATGVSVATVARSLGEAVREREPEGGYALADAVTGLGSAAGEDLTFQGLERLRDDWLRIRRRYFRPAPWFAEPEIRGSQAERVTAARLSALASRLEALIQEGAVEVQMYAESAGQPDRNERFEGFLAEWRQRLEETWNDRPPTPGSRADPRILVAAQGLEQAFRQVQALSSDAGFVRGTQPAARFNGILRQVETAQSALAAAGS